ncbi:2'-5' RNA ligase [Clostridium ganghwense]|uniref:2'-5' RNA ligase n=1 Tax=Clostridium ganghwense TaxID=312089 RepID=A0ABT4CSN8_9CLOT|nr:2'-5' RNA ligase [Clostridium ganghwense]MCY6372077.1 2'-5' RNA ligase [Clostridium ganghwense]
MKYHLVALFDDKSNDFITSTQQKLCKKYKLYKTNQKFHIPIQTIINPDMDKFNKIVLDTLAPYKKFKVQVSPNLYLDKSSKTLNLKVQNKGYIIRIARNITDTLSLSGFTLKNDYEKNLQIYIANSNYTIRKSLSNESTIALTTKTENSDYNFAKINRLELWKPINNKKEILIKSYPLREY